MSEPAPTITTASPAPTAAEGRSARDLLHGASLTSQRDTGKSLRRDFAFEPGTVDKEKRTVALSFSSEAPVLRADFSGRQFWEVLDHKAVDMSRMEAGATPLLFGHERSEHLGTVTASAIGPDKRGRAIVKFSRSTFAQEKFQDVEDGILTRTSVGYDLGNADYVADGEREGIPVYRFRNWQPYEITLTPIPADPSVGVGRSQPQEPRGSETQNPEPKTQNLPPPSRTMSAPATSTPAPAVTNVIDYSAERQRVKDINAAARQLATRHASHLDGINTLARTCAEEGATVENFQARVLNEVLATTPAAPANVRQINPELGLNNKEQRDYSILKAIREVSSGRALTGLEKEASEAEGKRLGRDAGGFFVPAEVFAFSKRHIAHQRALSAGSASAGGYTIAETIDTANMVQLLRNQSHVIGLGARVLGGLVGNISIPRHITGASVYWVSENGTITDSSAAFGQIQLKPRRMGATTQLGKQLIAQSSLDVEMFARDDINAAIGIELDRVAINGDGGAEPLGILNLAAGSRAGSVTFGAAPTWAKVVSFETEVDEDNALGLAGGAYAFLTTPGVRGAWKTTSKVANTAVFLWENGDLVNGYAARSTNQVPSDKVIFGQFGQVLIGEWAGTDIVVDNVTLATTHQIKVTIQKLVDVTIRQGKAFSISTDAGNQ